VFGLPKSKLLLLLTPAIARGQFFGHFSASHNKSVSYICADILIIRTSLYEEMKEIYVGSMSIQRDEHNPFYLQGDGLTIYRPTWVTTRKQLASGKIVGLQDQHESHGLHSTKPYYVIDCYYDFMMMLVTVGFLYC